MRIINVDYEIFKKGGHLDLEGKRIKEGALRDGIIVPKNAYLNGAKIDRLPKGMVVLGSLFLTKSTIKELPDDLIVGGCIDIEGTSITEIPHSIYVGRFVNVMHTAITEYDGDNSGIHGMCFSREPTWDSDDTHLMRNYHPNNHITQRGEAILAKLNQLNPYRVEWEDLLSFEGTELP